MTVALELPPDVESRFKAEAAARGISIDRFLSDLILHRRPSGAAVPQSEFDRAFEEAADLIPPDVPPLEDSAFSREGLYTREDDWTR